MQQDILKSIPAALGLLILIFDGALALEGAREGIELCIRTVIPSLFPFFVLSMALTVSLSGRVSRPLLALSDFLAVPRSAAPILIPGFLGGYPVGAKCVTDLYRKNHIRRTEAERLLAFCSNAGPSFLFGMVSGFFPEKKDIWYLWLIQINAALLTACLVPAPQAQQAAPCPSATREDSDIILSAARAMTAVCSWVILFRVLVVYLNRWIFCFLPSWVQVLLIGILELTNGCCALPRITDPQLRFVLCSCMLSWGGICVLMQTASVTKGLPIGSYLRGKALQTAFSLLMSCIAASGQGWLLVPAIPCLLVFFRKSQNRYGNPGLLPV